MQRAPMLAFLNDRLVGRLSKQPNGEVDFTYDPDWLGWEHALPISLSLPLRESRYKGEAVAAVFDNLLPDSEAMRPRIAERMGAAGTDAFSLLAAIGRDCIGALQFVPDDGSADIRAPIAGETLEEGDIERMIANLETAPLGLGLELDEDYRVALPGARAKIALLFHGGKWKRPHGRTPTTHILKPRISRLQIAGGAVDLSNSVENEYYCLRALAAFGLGVADSEIRTFGEHKVLIVERTDRRWTRDIRLIRLPLEDGCQALSVPPARKYQAKGGPDIAAIAGLLKGSDDPLADLRALFAAQILFWLLGVGDAHAKRFGLALGPAGRFRLAPFQDALSLQPNVDAGQLPPRDFKLAMAVGHGMEFRIEAIKGRHFLESARMARIPPHMARDMIATIASRAEEAFDQVERSLPPDFPAATPESIRTAAMIRIARLERALDERKA